MTKLPALRMQTRLLKERLLIRPPLKAGRLLLTLQLLRAKKLPLSKK